MKRLVFNWLTLLLMVFIAASFTACGGDDGDDPRPVSPPSTGGDGSGSSTIKPTDDVADPEGTVSISMRNANNGKTYLGDYIYIDNGDNFTGSSARFVSLGAMKGLGNVAKIPVAGWAEKVSCTPGNGYVFYEMNSNTYYRAYVTAYTTNVANEVIGAEVKYQRPFKGIDEALQPEKTTLDMSGNGDHQTIKMLNQTIIPYTVAASKDWLYAQPYLNQLTVYADPSTTVGTEEATLTLTTLYGKKTELKVTRTLPPEVSFEQSSLSIDRGGGDAAFLVHSNADPASLDFSASDDWVSLEARYFSPSGKYFQLYATAQKNRMAQERTARIDVKMKNGTLLASAEVKQAAGEAQTIDGTRVKSAGKIGFDRAGGGYVFTMNDVTTDKAASSASWCTVQQNGSQLIVSATPTTVDRQCTIKFSKSGLTLEVLQSKYVPGEDYNEGGLTGTVACIDAYGTRFICRYVGEAKWSMQQEITGTTDEYDGRINTDIIRQKAGYEFTYPAFGLCTALGDGWYLPSYEEGGHLYYNRIASSGWTSTEGSSYGGRDEANVFGSGWRNKTETHSVYAAHRF